MPKSTLYAIEKFTYLPEESAYVCPEGKPLKYVGINELNRTHLPLHPEALSGLLAEGAQCTRGKYRILSIHTCQTARQRAYEVAKHPPSLSPGMTDGKPSGRNRRPLRSK